MGFFGVSKINGDYFNVMGLPLHLIYRKLNAF
jgi:predicted house-cleaning NTP pyrophosphatase (Maf/HAM1 superfamily)